MPWHGPSTPLSVCLEQRLASFRFRSHTRERSHVFYNLPLAVRQPRHHTSHTRLTTTRSPPSTATVAPLRERPKFTRVTTLMMSPQHLLAVECALPLSSMGDRPFSFSILTLASTQTLLGKSKVR